jgi:hypothetical protein
MADKKSVDAYDKDKHYGVNLKKAVEFEGFTFKPGPNPVDVEMTGDWCNKNADAIEDAVEIDKPVESVEVQPETHETAA